MPGKSYSFFVMSYNRSPIGKCLLKIINQTFPFLLGNISYSFPITLLVYISLYRVMKTNAIFLAIGVAAVLAVALAPSVGNVASAEKTVECTNGGGHEKDCGSPPAKKWNVQIQKTKKLTAAIGINGLN